MGNKNSAIYDDILSEFERNPHLLIIQSSENKSAKIYVKSDLQNPLKVVTIWNVKNGVATLQTTPIRETEIVEQLLSTVETQTYIIEYYSGKNSLEVGNMLQQVRKDFLVSPFFESDGTYKVTMTFLPYISMKPGSYKVLYYLTTKTNKESHELPNETETETETEPEPDTYGKI
ncbi:MAG: hypothetical protein EBT86_00980 [Actinobacteria bacterium]|nr:hypothetical protein [Actinomycetota bacterium]